MYLWQCYTCEQYHLKMIIDKKIFLSLIVRERKQNKKKSRQTERKGGEESRQVLDDDLTEIATYNNSRRNMRGWPLTIMILHRKPRAARIRWAGAKKRDGRRGKEDEKKKIRAEGLASTKKRMISKDSIARTIALVRSAILIFPSTSVDECF